MKKQVRLILALIVASLFTFTGCKKEQPVYKHTTLKLTTTERVKAGSFIGYFTSSGDPTASGTWTMQSTPAPNSTINCTQTLTVPGVGTITALTNCSMIDNTGTWNIVSGTGAYANLHGNGTLLMVFPKEGNSSETWKGITWRK